MIFFLIFIFTFDPRTNANSSRFNSPSFSFICFFGDAKEVMNSAAQKRSILELAKTHQVQLHPQSVKGLLAVLEGLDQLEQQQTLRAIFATFHDECAEDRNITPEKMAKCIATHSASMSTSSVSRMNHHQVVKLQETPTLVVDETTGGTLRIVAPNEVPTSRMHVLRQRHCLALQRCFRSGLFRKNISGVEGVKPLLAISSLEGISGSQEVCVLGILSRSSTSGLTTLEDTKSSVEIDFTSLVAHPVGYISNLTLVVASGYWTGTKFSARKLAFPPPESRSQTLPSLGGLDTFGLLPSDVQRARMIEQQMLSSVCCVLSHVHLDSAHCLAMLNIFFREFESRPADVLGQMTFVLVGDFVSQPWSLGDIGHLGDSDRRKLYSALLESVASIVLQSAPSVAANSMFVFVPGPNDPTGVVGTLPQMPLPFELTSALRSKLKNVILAPNPCRLRFLTQEIVLCRKDFYHDMQSASWKWPHAPVVVDDEERADTDGSHYSTCALTPQTIPVQFELICKTIADQAHLAPMETSILWRMDSTLRLIPLPQVVILCDRTEQWHCQYKGSHFLNPGSFATTGTFLWYTPCDGEFVLNQVS